MTDPDTKTTPGESYFFRDKGQFRLLKCTILPELIRRNAEKRSIRIWSAGCSTGEEPYSIAMVLKDLLPPDWEALILGTDSNDEHLEKAVDGVYTDWSFRMVDASVKERFFRRGKGKWTLDREIRNMVAFRKGDLLKEQFPSIASEIHTMDAIVCRNVFIYFAAASIAEVVKKFGETLNEGGYLITGHGELYGQKLHPLKVKMFPDSIVYIKDSRGEIAGTVENARPISLAPRPVADFQTGSLEPPAVSPPPGLRIKTPAATSGSRQFIPPQAMGTFTGSAASGLPKRTGVENRPVTPAAPVKAPSAGPEEDYRQARIHADSGRYDEAAACCLQAISAAPLSPDPYFLLALVREALGDVEEAKTLLKKVVYLAPDHVASYLELASVYDAEKDFSRAKKMRMTARGILERLPPDTVIELLGDATTGELLESVNRTLA